MFTLNTLIQASESRERSAAGWWPGGFGADVPRISNADARHSLERLCRAMAAWLAHETETPPLTLVADALRHGSVHVSLNASIALALCLERVPGAGEVLLRMFLDAPAVSRRLMLRWVRSRDLPRGAVLEMVRAGLSDRARPVRVFAVEAAESLSARDFLPELHAMRRRETHPELLETLDFSISLLERGYHATPTRGGWEVWLAGEGYIQLHFVSAEAAALAEVEAALQAKGEIPESVLQAWRHP
jgi:hypothetical protein